MRTRKIKLTYGPRNVDDVPWASVRFVFLPCHFVFLPCCFVSLPVFSFSSPIFLFPFVSLATRRSVVVDISPHL